MELVFRFFFISSGFYAKLVQKLLNQIVRFTHVKEQGIAMASFYNNYADAYLGVVFVATAKKFCRVGVKRKTMKLKYAVTKKHVHT